MDALKTHDSFSSEHKPSVKDLPGNKVELKRSRRGLMRITMIHKETSPFTNLPLFHELRSSTTTRCAQALVSIAYCLVLLSIASTFFTQVVVAIHSGDDRIIEASGVTSSPSSAGIAESLAESTKVNFASENTRHHRRHPHRHHHFDNSLPSSTSKFMNDDDDDENIFRHRDQFHLNSHPKNQILNGEQYVSRSDEIEAPKVQQNSYSRNEPKQEFEDKSYNRIQQQVPEQLSIVVSSNSDNSYVSASPIENTTPHHHNLVSHHFHNQHYNHHKEKSNPYISKHVPFLHQNQQKLPNSQHHKIHNSLHRKSKNDDDRNRLLKSGRKDTENDLHTTSLEETFSSDAFNGEKGDIVSKTSQLDQQKHLVGGDISTTATTTQRNSIDRTRKLQRNLVQDEVDTELSSDVEHILNDDRSSDTLEDNKMKVDQVVRSNFNIKRASIIKTKESIRNGATFLNYTLVTTLHACLVECWITESCDTVVYQESPVDFDSNHLPIVTLHTNTHQTNHQQGIRPSHNSLPLGSAGTSYNYQPKSMTSRPEYDTEYNEPMGFFVCYLFECFKPDGFKCHFSLHNYYVSATAKKPTNSLVFQNSIDSILSTMIRPIDLNAQALSDIHNRLNFSSSMASPAQPFPPKLIDVEKNQQQPFVCMPDQFKCLSRDECIPNYQECDGKVQCSDLSDESACGESFKMFNYPAKNQISTNHDSSTDLSLVRVGQHSGDKSLVRPRDTKTSVNSLKEYQLMDFVEIKADKRLNEAEIDRGSSRVVDSPHYSRIINGYHTVNDQHPTLTKKRWHETHIASIRIGQEEYDTQYDGRGGLNSAIIAIMFGIGVTGMLIMIVGHKMNSIRRRIAHKGRHRSLVPDADFLINTMPI